MWNRFSAQSLTFGVFKSVRFTNFLNMNFKALHNYRELFLIKSYCTTLPTIIAS
eukprot:UN00630